MDKPRIILGIDPGTQLLGFGVIRALGKKAEYVDMGILDLRKEKDAYVKLKAIYDCITEVCKSYHPDELAIESPFYGKNAQVVLKLGRAQGAAIIAALESGVSSVTEYAPRKAKEAIVGNGAASKEQVQRMLRAPGCDGCPRHRPLPPFSDHESALFREGKRRLGTVPEGPSRPDSVKN